MSNMDKRGRGALVHILLQGHRPKEVHRVGMLPSDPVASRVAIAGKENWSIMQDVSKTQVCGWITSTNTQLAKHKHKLEGQWDISSSFVPRQRKSETGFGKHIALHSS